MLLWQVLAILIVVALVVLLILTFIAPGPLKTRPPRMPRNKRSEVTRSDSAHNSHS